MATGNLEDKEPHFLPKKKGQSFSNHRYQRAARDSTIGGIYSVGRKIGAGNFGELRIGKDIANNQLVAVKLELTKAKTPQLIFEYRFYKMLSPAVGFPKVFYYGQFNKHNALVMELLGPNLEEMFDLCSRKFSVKTIIMIALQTLRRIQYVHSKQLIYRDIKPENFVIGRGLENMKTIYQVDFGLAKRYIDMETNQHIPFRDQKSLTGTARYMSINTHLGLEQSRRDDLEALGHMYVYFFRGSLPWQGLKAATVQERYQKISAVKQKMAIDDLCRHQPHQLATYFKYVRSLGFSNEPDYEYLYKLLHSVLSERKYELDWQFDWFSRKSLANFGLVIPDDNEGEIGHEDFKLNYGHSSIKVLMSNQNFFDVDPEEKPVCPKWCCFPFNDQ